MSGAYGDDGVQFVIAEGSTLEGARPGTCRAYRREIAPPAVPLRRKCRLEWRIPYVMVTCEECLRVFQLVVVKEMTGQVLEVPCRFCPS